MITFVIVILGLLFLFGLTFGIRARQPLAIVASLFLVATLYCGSGYAMAGMLTGSKVGAEFWGIAAVLSFTCAAIFGFAAWRKAQKL